MQVQIFIVLSFHEPLCFIFLALLFEELSECFMLLIVVTIVKR